MYFCDLSCYCILYLAFVSPLFKEVAVVNTEPMGFMKSSRPDNSEPKSDDDDDDDNDSDTFGRLCHALRFRIRAYTRSARVYYYFSSSQVHFRILVNLLYV